MPNLSITTTQGVKLFFTPASAGERILAYSTDILIKIAYSITAYILFFTVMDIRESINNDNGMLAFLIFILSIPVLFYTLACETLMEGQTLGKKLLKIKVVKIDGYQAGFFEYFIRWIFGLVDIQMGFIPGIISMIVTKHTQRLGDIAASTAVISEKSKYNISHTILMDVKEDYMPYFAQNKVLLFSDNDIRIIKENSEVAIRQDNADVLLRLESKIEQVMNIKNPFKSSSKLIDTLMKDYNYYTCK